MDFRTVLSLLIDEFGLDDKYNEYKMRFLC